MALLSRACPGNLDPVKSKKAMRTTAYGSTSAPGVAGSPNNPAKGTNYYDETIGLNWKPEVPKTFDGMVVRPEARWDYSSDTKPYNDGTQHNQFTFGADVIVPFASQ